MAIQLVCTTGIAGYYFSIIEKQRRDPANAELYDFQKTSARVLINCLLVVAQLLQFFFFSIEMRQFLKGPIAYLTDYSNWLDMCSQFTSLSYFIVFQYSVFTDNLAVQVSTFRVWGGLACMLLWIRMFQWMRLFKETAHFITLLSRVLADMKTFDVMWLIVMAAFGNFYYTLNNNSPMTNENHYVGNYTYFPIVDAIIQMYLFSLGELDIEAQRDGGPNHITSFILFVLSTFVLCVIFLNLIIAIIEETYLDVNAKAEEYGLYEQANLIKDMLWLLDTKELFKNKRYIILLEKQDSIPAQEQDTEDQIAMFQLGALRRQQENLDSMSKKLTEF